MTSVLVAGFAVGVAVLVAWLAGRVSSDKKKAEDIAEGLQEDAQIASEPHKDKEKLLEAMRREEL